MTEKLDVSNASTKWLIDLGKLYGLIPKNMPEAKKRCINEEGIWALHEKGMSNRKISQLLNIPSRTIDRRIKYLSDKKAGRPTRNLRDY